MSKNIFHFYFIHYFFLLSCAVSCLEKTAEEEVISPQNLQEISLENESIQLSDLPGKTKTIPEIEMNSNGELLRADGRSKRVSALDLEGARFAIEYLTPGYQQYLNAETLVLTFDRPIDSDYVEILRCRSDVIINTGIVLIDFKDWALNGMTENEKISMYSAGDVFTMALAEQGCTYLNEASLEENIPDSWAPSGSYRYLATACIAPNRLTDTHLYSKRNCSRRFALSPLVHYTNKRKEDEKAAIHDLETVRSGLDILASTLGEQAFTLIEAMDTCERREQQRAVATELKNSVLQLVGASIEIVLELIDFCESRGLFKSAAKGISKSGAKGAMGAAAEGAADNLGKNLDGGGIDIGSSPDIKADVDADADADGDNPGFIQNAIDVAQVGQATEGATFTMILQNLFATAADMPRSCETVLALNERLEVTMEEIYVLAQQYVYFEKVLAQVQKGLSDQAGLESESIDIESLNPTQSAPSTSGGASSGGIYDD